MSELEAHGFSLAKSEGTSRRNLKLEFEIHGTASTYTMVPGYDNSKILTEESYAARFVPLHNARNDDDDLNLPQKSIRYVSSRSKQLHTS